MGYFDPSNEYKKGIFSTGQENDICALIDIIMNMSKQSSQSFESFFKNNIYLTLTFENFTEETKIKFITKALRQTNTSILNLMDIIDEPTIVSFMKQNNSIISKSDFIKVIDKLNKENIPSIIAVSNKLSSKDIKKVMDKHIKEKDLAIFDTKFSRKTNIRNNLYSIFVSTCKSEEDFDFWVGKKKINGGGYCYKAHIKTKDDFTYFEKILNCGMSFNIIIHNDVSDFDSVEKMFDIISNISHNRNNPDITDLIKKLTNILHNNMKKNNEYDIDRINRIPFVIKKIRKGCAFTFANKMKCELYISYKKL